VFEMVQDLGILVAHGRVPGQAQLQLDSDVLTRVLNRTSDSKLPGMFISSQTAAVGARRVSASTSPASSQARGLLRTTTPP